MAGAQEDSGGRGDILRNKHAPLHISSVLGPEHTGQAGRFSFTRDPGSSQWLRPLSSPSDDQGKRTRQGSGMFAGQWGTDSLGGHREAEQGRGWVTGTHQVTWAREAVLSSALCHRDGMLGPMCPGRQSPWAPQRGWETPYA